jgi:fatty-acyl-CoA synthase
VWITEDLPATATNKIIKRQLSAQGLQVPSGVLWRRDARGSDYQSEP